MSKPVDQYGPHRAKRLEGVATRLRGLGIDVEFGVLVPYYDLYGGMPEGLTGLVVPEPDGPGRMQVTVVSARRTAPPGEGGLSADGRTWVRDVDLEYDLGADMVFEVTTLDAFGDGPVWAPRRLVDTEQAVVDAIRLWHGYRDTLRSTPPPPDRRRRSALARQAKARHTAAAAAKVRIEADGDLLPDDLDPELLCYHFPRDRNGRYGRTAVVALAGDGSALSKRGPWLAARAAGDTLVVGVEALIGANQDHRWDRLPWLWRTGERDAPPTRRWQAPDAATVAPIAELLARHELIDAFTLCGVEVDAEIGALLSGYPIDYSHARYTETWVRVLYTQLPDCAPWRLAAAYRAWQDERREARRPADEPIALFGLKGLNQQSRPMVALDARNGPPRLTMIWTASNARLTRALWDCPADLTASLLDT
ncbi:MAG TPA: hypothetical protein VL738_01355 [Dactylosporangium sp.]|nr:hypothetical protein [Dactylosporangium sp.]